MGQRPSRHWMIDTLVGRSIWDEDVPTPLVYVDRRALERNIHRMAEAALRSGVALRPHAKTQRLRSYSSTPERSG